MENGHGEIPKHINIFREGKVDPDSVQKILEDFKNVLIDISFKVDRIETKVDEIEEKMKPAITFYKKVTTIMVFLSILFTVLVSLLGLYLK